MRRTRVAPAHDRAPRSRRLPVDGDDPGRPRPRASADGHRRRRRGDRRRHARSSPWRPSPRARVRPWPCWSTTSSGAGSAATPPPRSPRCRAPRSRSCAIATPQRSRAPTPQGNLAAVETVARLVEDLGIECEAHRRTAITFATDTQERSAIEQEAEAAREAGLPVTLVEDVPVPHPGGGGRLARGAARDPSAPVPAGARARVDRRRAVASSSAPRPARVSERGGPVVHTEGGPGGPRARRRRGHAHAVPRPRPVLQPPVADALVLHRGPRGARRAHRDDDQRRSTDAVAASRPGGGRRAAARRRGRGRTRPARTTTPGAAMRRWRPTRASSSARRT